ncbi:hypothetical protein ACFU3E_19125 [Streptomyces sp. NPDC057424]|uniref:hypothetical protein n=1 Tax=Streptomyces sp. NPDC057424 TaxID=3346127 RepID=UPI00369E77D0
MGIRTLLSRTAPGVARPPTPAIEAAASTVRVPVTFTTALRRATADLRQRLAVRGRRPTGSGDLTAATTLPGGDDPAAAPVLAGLADTDVLSALTGLARSDVLSALTGANTKPTGTDPPAATGHAPTEARPRRTPKIPGKPSRAWAQLARDYLTLVLTLLPRPRPAHTTITVYITTTGSALSERPGGSAQSRGQGQGQDRRGPEPDAAP